MSSFISCQTDSDSEADYKPRTTPKDSSYSAGERYPGGIPSPAPSQEEFTDITYQMEQTRLGTSSDFKRRKLSDKKASNVRRQELRANKDRYKRASRPQYTMEENHAITYLRDDVGLDWRETRAKHNIFFKHDKEPETEGESQSRLPRSISGLQSRYYRIHGAETNEEKLELRNRKPQPSLGLLQTTTKRYWWMFCDSEKQYQMLLPSLGSSSEADKVLSQRAEQLKQSCLKLKNKSRELAMKKKSSIKRELKMEAEPYRPCPPRIQDNKSSSPSISSSSSSSSSSPSATNIPSSSLHMKISFLCH